jgi:hypothetical protein
VRKRIVTVNGVIERNRNESEIKKAGKGKKVGIPPELLHALADVRPYL